MLLQSIVLELDRYLGRLLALRKIIASLEKNPDTIRHLPVGLSRVLNAEPTPLEAPKPRKPKSLREAPTPKKKFVPEIGPLMMSRPILTGPVVVSPRQLEEERQRRLTPQTQTALAEVEVPAETVDLDQMTRSLSARWFMGSLQ